jgi:thiamine biosynthesis lipoprotein
VVNHQTEVLARIRASLQETAANGCRRVGFRAMGTWCQLVFTAPSRAAGDFFVQEAIDWVTAFESRYSRFLPDSLISAINNAAGKSWVEVDPETEQLLALCNELFFYTRGAFDPTALPLLKLWNWKANPPSIPTDAAVVQARSLTGWNKVQRKSGAVFLPVPGMSLDLGGIGKEYAVDRVLQIAQEHGLQAALVDFGQDLRVHGLPADKPAWHIGLDDPRKPGECWASLAVRDRAVATSGDYLRHFTHNGRRFGHIIDPRNGEPVANGCLAVTVLAPTCTIAGVLSTTAFILGPREGLALIESYLGAAGCITTHNSRHQTKSFYENLCP